MKTQPAPQPAKLDDRAMADYVARIGQGVQLQQSGRYLEARKQFEQLIRQCPGRYEAYHCLGQICDRQKCFAESQDNYQRAVLLAGNTQPDVFNDLGYSFFLQGKLDKAEIAVRKAVALRPTEPRYHDNLGLIYGNQRRFDDAWNEFRLAGGEADAFYDLAFIKASLNDFEGAKACLRRALSVDPAHDRARRTLRAYELAETDPDSLAELAVSNDEGTQWVPYVEGGQGQDPATTAKDAGGKFGTAGSPANATIASHNMRESRGN